MIPPGRGLIFSHPALRALGRRVRVRWVLERTRAGLLAGLAGVILAALAGRVLDLPWWPAAAAALLALAWLVSILANARRWPDVMAVARAADALGLEERASSALYASGAGHPAAPLLAADANRLLARLDPADYPLVIRPRRWVFVALALCLAGFAIVVPLPMSGESAGRAAEARAVAAARQSVEALRAEAIPLATPEPLSRSVAEELGALEERVGSAGDAREADRALEEAQERLAALGRPEDFAWQRALEGLSAALAGQAVSLIT